MNPILVYHCPSEGSEGQLPWTIDTTGLGIVTYSTRSHSEILNYARCYDLLLILMHESSMGDDPAALMAQLRENLNGKLPRTPIMIVSSQIKTHEELMEFQAMGVDAVLPAETPCCLVLWQLNTLLALKELREFEQHRMDVKEMAAQTRELLHDLSQPLAAVQGRLQLMAARCAADDPNAKIYNDLAGQAMDITKHLVQIQHLHRTFS